MITNIISAIGNNTSVYPLLVRDCGMEVPVKVVLTYNQNKKESKEIAYVAARERFLDEYATSAVWLGGVPLVGKVCDYLIKKSGYNPNVNLKLFNEKDGIQGIDYNIKKFKDIAPDAVKDLLKTKENKKVYQKLLAGKFIASTSIPIAVMGFVLPKLIFASSAKKLEELKAKNRQVKQMDFVEKDKFFKKKNVSFTGNWIEKTANFNTQDKMFVTDAGYAVGRMFTTRNRNETYDVTFKMAGMMFLNFIAPNWIEKALNKLTGVELDPLILDDKEFIKQIRGKKLSLPKSDNAKDLLEFVDDVKNSDTIFVKYAKKFEKIKMLENGVRDPREYVDIKKLGKFRNDIENFAKKAVTLKGKDFNQFVKKSKFAKSANILTNVALSSYLLSYTLPKVQFAFRKFITGSDLEPGLVEQD